MKFIIDNLEYIVPALAAPISIYIMFILKHHTSNNDLTQYIVKYGKQKSAITKMVR